MNIVTFSKKIDVCPFATNLDVTLDLIKRHIELEVGNFYELKIHDDELWSKMLKVYLTETDHYFIQHGVEYGI
jgi:hypothetical protein